MTALLIDVGNSRCKYAWMENHRIKRRSALALDCLSEMSRVARQWRPAMPMLSYMISVASDSINRTVAAAVTQCFGKVPIVLAETLPLCGLKSDYQAEQLGIDRATVMLAAWQRLRQACIVIDCGTAVTIDCIDDNGVHKGGMILPSDDLMRFSLSDNTARLEYFDTTSHTADVFATGTEAAIACGCQLAWMAAVSQVVREMRRRCRRDVAVIATGGGAHLLADTAAYRRVNIPPINHLTIVPTLAFEGMMVLIEEKHL